MSHTTRALALACIAVGAASVASFSHVSPAVAAPVSNADQMGMTDANIAAMVMAINDSEIGAAEAALTDKKVTGDAKSYAEMMKKDHTNNNEQLKKIADKAGIKPEQTDDIKAMAQKNADELKQLKTLDGDAFAKGYIDMMVTGHTEALAKLDAAISAAQNEDLKKFLDRTKGHVQHHLDKAKDIQGKMMK